MTVIKTSLEAKKRTPNWLAQRVGGNRTRVYEVAKGFSRASSPLRKRIAEVLGTSVEELFDENGMARRAE